jgi:hypothetical protein
MNRHTAETLVRDVTARLVDQFFGERNEFLSNGKRADFCLTSFGSRRQAFFSDVKRLAKCRRPFPSRLIATLAAALFLIFPGDGHRNWAVDSALAQAEAKTKMQRKLDYREFIDSCAGRRIEFTFGATSLHIDPRWLDGTTVDLMNRFPYGCPAVPVADISPISFNKAVLELANIPGGMGDPFFFFQIGRAAPTPYDPPPGTNRPAQVSEPVVVEVKQSATALEYSRVYDLHYPDNNDSSATIVRVSCGGEAGKPAGRGCFTVYRYRYRRDLIINYKFRQDQLPIPRSDQASSPEGLTEPQGILIFDTRIRAWIDSLTAKP